MANAADLDKDSAQALQTLYKNNPTAEVIAKKAKAILVFPKILKAGLVFGGSYGEGVLMKGGRHRLLQLRVRLLGLAGRRGVIRLRRLPDE